MTDLEIRNQKIKVASAMVRYGGSFMSNLGKALYNADEGNARKVYENWTEDWVRYLGMAVSG